MLALRDQENLVHTHQTIAAAKPLNNGVKQLQPKTPGARAPKTPFKVPLNDENNPLAFGKKTVKANGNADENTKPGKDAFVTPFAGKSRAPLGMKTTNAKARGLQTPAPGKGPVKPEKTNKRSSTTQRIKKIAPLAQQSQVDVQDKVVEDDVPDIEYMPPKPKELPDLPDEITYDTTFPQFQPRNLALGLESVYRDEEVGSDGLTKKQRKHQEDSIAYDKMVDEIIMKQIESIDLVGFDAFEETPEARPASSMSTEDRRITRATANRLRNTSNTSTIRSRDAAAALSGTKSTPAQARSAPASKPRGGSSLLTARGTRAPTPTNPSAMRHTAATASSKTTLGYSKGRSVCSTLHGQSSDAKKQPPSKTILSPQSYIGLYGPPPLGSEMWLRCKAAGCFEEEGQSLEREIEALPTFGEDEEAQNFQLTL